MNWYKKYLFAGLSGFATRKVLKKLKNLGARYVRQGMGDHQIWMTPDGKTISIPIGNSGRDLPPGTLRNILQTLNVNEQQFLNA